MICNWICGRARTITLALTMALTLLPGSLHPGPASAAERVGGEFALERVDLRFVGGEKVRILAVGQDVRAEVKITFTGTGQLGGAWEIAESTSTAGSPRFRTLELVSRLLGMGRHEVLTSPPLPTATIGAYQLRLRITQPELIGPPLLLRYFVGQRGGEAVTGQAGVPGAIAARGPAAGSSADSLQFSWQPVAGSIAYQLEIYEKDGAAARGEGGQREGNAALFVSSASMQGQPVAGVIVPGSETAVSAAKAFGDKLATGKTYTWRVVAIGVEGRSLAESAMQELVR